MEVSVWKSSVFQFQTNLIVSIYSLIKLFFEIKLTDHLIVNSMHTIALREALNQKVPGKDLVDFIEQNDGIEQIRLDVTKPLSAKVRAGTRSRTRLLAQNWALWSLIRAFFVLTLIEQISRWFLLEPNLTFSNYDRIDKILGDGCPEFPRDKALFSNLSSYYSSLDRGVIFTALHNYLH